MGIFIVYIILVFVVAHFGSQRKIGYWTAFFVALLLSPLVGFIAVALSLPKDNDSSSGSESESDFNIDDFRKQ